MVEKKAKNDHVVNEGKLYAMVAYLWILCLVPLFFKKDNQFALFHGKQGLVLFIGELAISVIGVVPFLGWLCFFVGTLVFGVLSLVGIVNALIGNYWKMPVVGDLAEKISLS